MTKQMLIGAISLWGVLTIVESHGAMTFPRPRSARDGELAPWSQWSYPCDATHQGDNCSITFCEDGHKCQGSCPISSHNGVYAALNASNGQSCYWFSNGCMVGCDVCDGTNNHYGHGNQEFLYKGMDTATLIKNNITLPNPWDPPTGDMTMNPASIPHLNIRPNCAKPTRNATICDPRLRTMNTQAECGSALDIYYYSPWRAPGSAPVIDSCGVAGGRFKGQGTGGAGAQFQNNSVFTEGEIGSKVPKGPSQASWAAGGVYEVGWTVQAHHGGGYAYRLAPADGPLNEKTFGEMALDFHGESFLRWGGNRSSQLAFDPVARGWQTDVGTVPAGSQWRKLPIPTILWAREGPSFAPVCNETEECRQSATHGRGPVGSCKCSGHSNEGPLLPNLEVVDNVIIPKDTPPGDYVLQFRWDCEETSQIWSQCSDITITAPN